MSFMFWLKGLFSHSVAVSELALVNAISDQHHVLASNFADPADRARFMAAKARGLSDAQAFRYGDNCVGFWGANTCCDTPMCALPPEDIVAKWGTEKAGNNKLVRVRAASGGEPVLCLLSDVMPHKRNITNGCGIDLNPGAVKALGLHAPLKTPVAWDWA